MNSDPTIQLAVYSFPPQLQVPFQLSQGPEICAPINVISTERFECYELESTEQPPMS